MISASKFGPSPLKEGGKLKTSKTLFVREDSSSDEDEFSKYSSKNEKMGKKYFLSKKKELEEYKEKLKNSPARFKNSDLS